MIWWSRIYRYPGYLYRIHTAFIDVSGTLASSNSYQISPKRSELYYDTSVMFGRVFTEQMPPAYV